MAVILIMWMTYYLSEWNNLEGDHLNQGFNRFSGGSRVMVNGLLPTWVPLLFGYGCLVGAVFTGLYIYLRYQTGSRTLLLGGIGIFSGFFYSGKPFRWSYRGVGEIFIGFCYGWLPIATGFYLLAGFFGHQILLLSIPVGISVFNVILINEFPDEDADRTVGKKNLVVRFGKERMADLYMGLSIVAGLSFIKVLKVSGPISVGIFVLAGLPILLILFSLMQVLRGDYRDWKRLESLCRDTLFINLLITMTLTVQQTFTRSILGKWG